MEGAEDLGASNSDTVPCTKENVFGIIKTITVTKIRVLAVQLDIEGSHLIDIEDCTQPDEKRSKLVDIWFKQCRPEPTWAALRDALLAKCMMEHRAVREIESWAQRSQRSFQFDSQAQFEDQSSPAYKCTEKNVLNAIAGPCEYDVYDLASKLGLAEVLRSTHCEMDVAKFKLVELWFRYSEEMPTWSTLLSALRALSRREVELADEIETGNRLPIEQQQAERNLSQASSLGDSTNEKIPFLAHRSASVTSSIISSPPLSPTSSFSSTSSSLVGPIRHRSEQGRKISEGNFVRIQRCFSDFVYKIKKHLKDNSANVRKFENFLKVFYKQKMPKLNFENIDDVFSYFISSGEWNFLEPKILSEAVEMFKDTSLIKARNEYYNSLSGFEATTKISMFIEDLDSRTRRSQARNRGKPYSVQKRSGARKGSEKEIRDELGLKLKIDVERYTMQYIKDLWKSLSHLGVPKIGVILDRIINNCMWVVWIVTIETISEDIRIKAYQPEVVEFFKEHEIVQVWLNDECLYLADGEEKTGIPIGVSWTQSTSGSIEEETEPDEFVFRDHKQIEAEPEHSVVTDFSESKAILAEAVESLREEQIEGDTSKETESTESVGRMTKPSQSKSIKEEIRDESPQSTSVEVLKEAISSGQVETVQDILNQTDMKVDTVLSNDGATALIIAAQNGHTELVSFFLNNGADSGVKLDNGQTALHLAAIKGHLDMADLLYKDKDSNDLVGVKDKRGFSPLMEAADHNQVEFVQRLLQNAMGPEIPTMEEACLLAAEKGHFDMVQALYRCGADSEEDETALMKACAHGHTHIVDYILTTMEGTNPDELGPQHLEDVGPALCLSIEAGHLKVVVRFLESKFRPDIIDYRDSDGSTPLMKAIQKRLAYTLLLEREADVNLKNNNGETALMMAALNGDEDSVQKLVKWNADIDLQQDTTGKTALHMACENGHVGVVKVLVAQRPKAVYIKDNNGKTAQDLAKTEEIRDVVKKASSKAQQLFEVLKKPFQGVKMSYLKTKLISACKTGNVEQARACIESGVQKDKNFVNSLDPVDAFNWTGLAWAAQNGHADVAKLLLEKGADPNLAIRGRWTPTILASRNGHYKVVRHLVDHNADVTRQNWQGWSALIWAAARGRRNLTKEAKENRVKTAEILLEKDPSKLIDICANDKWSPLMQASLDNNVGMVKLLLEKGANSALFNNKNWSALMLAAKHNRIDVVKALVEGGVRVDLENPTDKMTPLHVACEKGNNECLKAMVEALLPPKPTSEQATVEPLTVEAQAEQLFEETTFSEGATAEPSSEEPKATPQRPKPVVNLDVKDKWGMTPLILATKHGNKEATNLLVDAGADVNIKSEKYAGWSALHFAIKEGYLEIAKFLVVNKANMRSKDKNQQTPLGVAFSQRRDIYEKLKSFLAGKPQVLKAIKSAPEATVPGISTPKPQSEAPVRPEVPLSAQPESESIDTTLEELLEEVESESRAIPASKAEISGLEKEYRKYRAKAMESGGHAASAA